MISLDNTECYNDDVDEIDDLLAVSLLHTLNETEGSSVGKQTAYV